MQHNLALIGRVNAVVRRHGLAAYALNRPTESLDAVITMAGHLTGPTTEEGRQRLSKAHLKHGDYTAEKKCARAEGAAVERKLRARRKLIESELIAAGLIS